MEFVETSTKLKLTMSNMILTEFRQLNNLCLFRNCPITNQDRLILALASTWLGTIRSSRHTTSLPIITWTRACNLLFS